MTGFSDIFNQATNSGQPGIAGFLNSPLLNFGIGALTASGQPGASFGSSLAGGVRQAQESLAGATKQAFQSRLLKDKQEKEQRQEDRLQKKFELEQKKQETKQRQSTANSAYRVSSGIEKYSQDPLAYYNIISKTPEFQAIAQQYGFDPASITTPEQVQQLGQQLAQQSRIEIDKPKNDLQLKAIIGPDGKPMLVPEEEAVSKQPYYKPNAGTTVNVGQVTEGERKAATLGVRLEGALRALDEIAKVDPSALTPTMQEKALGSFTETGANMTRSPMRQQAQAAQLDALDAALTLSTGAAYTKEQLETLRSSYFPAIGDDPATVQAKQARYEALVNSAYVAAGRAAPAIGEALTPRGEKKSKFIKNDDGSFTYTP